jgi:DNA-nicking Smr family endonuclease
MQIDLHGVKHEDVGRTLDAFIWEQMQKKTSCIRIITGNSPEMKKIVNNIITEYGFVAGDSYGNSAAILVDLV